jgi:photosystem II stability/assembly factor-like uncharacterized protein
VFKSTNGGGQWAAVNTGLTYLYIASLVIDPADSNTLYAGTLGVFKSTNGGGRWVAVNTRGVYSLAIDPADSNTVYAGTFGNSIFASYDGGQTWN